MSKLHPHELATRFLTGSTTGELYQDTAMGKAAVPWNSERPDLGVHALASERMADRFGTTLANAAGYTKEAVQGAANMLRGGNFFDERGFSMSDIGANQAGLNKHEQENSRFRKKGLTLQGFIRG